jgi:hypothetical protein
MNVEISEYATRLLNVSGIERVISIDDDNAVNSSPEELVGVLNVVEQSVLTEVVGPLLSIESGDRDLIRDEIKNHWADLSKELRDQLLAKLTAPSEQSAESIALAVDMRVTSKLPEIFGDKLQNLTLAEWERQREQFVNDQMPPTLLLVDLSFTGENKAKDEGLRVIASLLKMHPESRIYCGLLTSVYHTSTVHADWKQIAADHELDRERFVLIPKDSLNDDKRAFLALLKLAIMNGTANALRNSVKESFKKCLDDSDIELSKLDVFEFERIICLTSSTEGVWEPDTLLRVFSLFHKKFVRRHLHSDSAVYGAADQLRNLSRIPVGEWGGPTEMEISLRKLEWFDEGEDINEQHLPLELGDVFKIESRPNKLYVLVAQPCDLMMRQNGKRHDTVKNVLLLEAAPTKDASLEPNSDDERDPGFYFKLDFFESGLDWEINLRKIHFVNLDVLDLCVFRADGRAALSNQDTTPALMSEAWRARFPRLAEKMKKARGRYTELMKMKGMKPADAGKVALTTSMGNLWNVTVDSKSIAVDVRRVGRIKQPRSGALLARYANSLARDAFEHDLTRRPDPHSTSSVGQGTFGVKGEEAIRVGDVMESPGVSAPPSVDREQTGGN